MAPATTTEMISTWENQLLDTVHQSQEAVVKTVGMLAEAGGNLIPKPIAMPYSDQIPAPAEWTQRARICASKRGTLNTRPLSATARVISETVERPSRLIACESETIGVVPP